MIHMSKNIFYDSAILVIDIILELQQANTGNNKILFRFGEL